MPPLSGWVALVLAAGRGRRMGGPKALMDAGGRPWWRVQEERLDAAEIRRLWVVSKEVAKALRDSSGTPEQLIEADPDAPMFESLRAGVANLPAETGVFVLPVDVPAPGPAVWSALAGAPGAAVPTYQAKRGHPAALPQAWIERVLLPALQIPAPGRLDRLLNDATQIAVSDPAVGINLNTPDDLRAWLAAKS